MGGGGYAGRVMGGGGLAGQWGLCVCVGANPPLQTQLPRAQKSNYLALAKQLHRA